MAQCRYRAEPARSIPSRSRRVRPAKRWTEQARERFLADNETESALRERLQLARLARAEGDAEAPKRQTLALRRELMAEESPTPLRIDLGRHLLRLRLDAGDAPGARHWLHEAADLAESLDDPRLHSRLALARAEIELAEGDADAASATLAAAATIGREPDFLRAQAELAAAHGDALAALGHEGAAKAAAGERWSRDDEARLQRRMATAKR